MTGRELYEKNREIAGEAFGVELPPWEELTPFRRANWNMTAADYVRKGLIDREDDDG